MSKKHKIAKRLLVCVLSVAVILAFTPTSLLAYADDNESEATTTIEEKAEVAETFAEEKAEETKAAGKEQATGAVKVVNPLWSIVVKKVWIDVPVKDQTEVKVLLRIGLEEFGPLTLNASNDWTASVEDLGMSSLYDSKITVIEGSYVDENGQKVFHETTDYNVEYIQEKDEHNETVWITVKNKSKNVEEATTTTGSTEPSEPTDSTEPSDSSSDKSGDKSSEPETGDSSNLAFAYWLLLLSAAGGALTILYRKRRVN